MIPDQTVIPWKEFRETNLIYSVLGFYNKVFPQTEMPFKALAISTVYSANYKFPGIHIFFSARFVGLDSLLFRGFIPRYFSGENPDFTLAQKIRWGSIVELRLDERSKGDIPIVEYHSAITSPIEFGSGESLYEITPKSESDTIEVLDWVEARRLKVEPICPLESVRLKLLEAHNDHLTE